MAKSNPASKKKEQRKALRWVITIFFVTILISGVISLVSDEVMAGSGMIIAFLILLLIVIVAAFNIVSSLVMLVKDKNKDIAVLRTFGVSRKSMMKIFVLSGTSIGAIGAFFGTILGVLVAVYIEPIRQFFQWLTGRDLFPAELYYLSELPSKLVWSDVLGIALIAILLAFLATLYPAWKAANTDPVEVLRNE